MKLTKEIFESVVKGSKMEYEYSQGGYPASGRRKFKWEDLVKVTARISKLNNLDTLVKRAAASKLIFGKTDYHSPYSAYIKRALLLGMTDVQLSEIENVSWDDYSEIKKDYFSEFKY